MKKSTTGGKRVTGSGRSASKSTYATEKPTQLRNAVNASKPKASVKSGGRKA